MTLYLEFPSSMFTKIRTMHVRHFDAQSTASVLSDNTMAVEGCFVLQAVCRLQRSVETAFIIRVDIL
jgi:hypothetical protein